jgi:hypothetical protein
LSFRAAGGTAPGLTGGVKYVRCGRDRQIPLMLPMSAFRVVFRIRSRPVTRGFSRELAGEYRPAPGGYAGVRLPPSSLSRRTDIGQRGIQA